MTNVHRRYIVAETGTSVVINVIISALFMFMVFGRSATIDLWGGHGLALDFIPQTFMITLMSVLVPTLLTRRRLKSGQVTAGVPRQPSSLTQNLIVRALVIAVVLTLGLGGLATLALNANWSGPVDFWHVFYGKLVYGALVAIVATPVGLAMALTEPARVAA